MIKRFKNPAGTIQIVEKPADNHAYKVSDDTYVKALTLPGLRITAEAPLITKLNNSAYVKNSRRFATNPQYRGFKEGSNIAGNTALLATTLPASGVTGLASLGLVELADRAQQPVIQQKSQLFNTQQKAGLDLGDYGILGAVALPWERMLFKGPRGKIIEGAKEIWNKVNPDIKKLASWIVPAVTKGAVTTAILSDDDEPETYGNPYLE